MMIKTEFHFWVDSVLRNSSIYVHLLHTHSHTKSTKKLQHQGLCSDHRRRDQSLLCTSINLAPRSAETESPCVIFIADGKTIQGKEQSLGFNFLFVTWIVQTFGPIIPTVSGKAKNQTCSFREVFARLLALSVSRDFSLFVFRERNIHKTKALTLYIQTLISPSSEDRNRINPWAEQSKWKLEVKEVRTRKWKRWTRVQAMPGEQAKREMTKSQEMKIMRM